MLAIPAQTLRANLAVWTPLFPADALLVSLIKGVELGTTKRMSEVISEVADAPAERVAIVTGPNLAREIAERQPGASVVACTDADNAERLQLACQTGYFRPYTNTDVVGCELAGAVKNVIALAVGIADGMGFGDNSKASLITRGLAETARLGVALGADPHTFSGLAGLGDLVATCSSPLSRNHSVGVHLGRGMSVEDALAATTTTAEPQRGETDQPHGGCLGVTEPIWLLGNERGLDGNPFGVGSFDTLISDPEHRVADSEISHAGTYSADDAREITAQDMRKLDAIAASAQTHLVISSVEACGVDVDEDLARPRGWIRRLTTPQHLRSAMVH